MERSAGKIFGSKSVTIGTDSTSRLLDITAIRDVGLVYREARYNRLGTLLETTKDILDKHSVLKSIAFSSR